ncbi:concanavalin A-like lectin/glucanase [Macroventuria anomochaeta]|uniref:Concanavalin A-like lectin/glucanase n=1 Tax=Macroventuria anomochaeta TaxID=301207 RepID=A0ACB6RR18_9PLEO|nr:concanavalin A-like lectin/glucanase [Macroventuria anomochaeta]KAF2623377.1 concanavalin A-like lectin/glucanase [Macroventuria anomochaeta]
MKLAPGTVPRTVSLCYDDGDIYTNTTAYHASVSSGAVAEKLLYRNTFSNSSSISSWITEGPVTANVTNYQREECAESIRRAAVKVLVDTNNTLTLGGAGKIDDYFVYWLSEVFPGRIRISWDFQPIQELGLAMFFFGATSVSGGSIFDPSLKPCNGSYPQYHSSDIRLLHASYFRRKWPEERQCHVANFKKKHWVQFRCAGCGSTS